MSGSVIRRLIMKDLYLQWPLSVGTVVGRRCGVGRFDRGGAGRRRCHAAPRRRDVAHYDHHAVCLWIMSLMPSGTTSLTPGPELLIVPGPAWMRLLYTAAYTTAIWCWTFGVIGAALRFLAQPSVVRRYVADSSYWLYLVHLPVVFFLGVVFANVPWHWSVKYPLIVAIACTVLVVSYHYVVRSTFVGEVLNGRRYRRASLKALLGSEPQIALAKEPAPVRTEAG